MLCIGFCEHLYRLYLVSAPDECISKALLSDAVKIFLWFQHRFKLAIQAKTVTRINTGHLREREGERERERVCVCVCVRMLAPACVTVCACANAIVYVM